MLREIVKQFLTNFFFLSVIHFIESIHPNS